MSDYGTPPPGNTGAPYGQPYPARSEQPAKGFFGALFDFRFEHFITPIIVKVVYVLALAGLVITWLVMLAGAFAGDSSGLGVTLLILGPIAIILYLAFIRMTLEFYLAIVRMSQDIHTRLR